MPDAPSHSAPAATARRRRRFLKRILLCGLGFILLGLLPHGDASDRAQAGTDMEILVFTRTEGFTHGSISDGVTMLLSIASELNATVTETSSTALFTPQNLSNYDVVVWLSTTGDVLDDPEQAAFEGYIRAGGGYVGIHAAADCEYDWPWYGELLGNGAWFLNHPSIQTATLEREGADPLDPGFPDAQTDFEDEWYNFQANPRPAVQVLMTLDEDSYDPGGGAMGEDHPITWAHEFDGGRAFYTGLGHRSQTFQDARFRAQIRNAIQWTSGATDVIFRDGFESGATDAWEIFP
ncbi:MAG: ThuA domain-containing protein [Acidobacteriota bacterium]